MPQPVLPAQQAPNVRLTSSEPFAVTVRSTLQLLSGGFIVEGIQLFLYDFTEAEAKWATGAFTVLLVFVQNFLEKRRGQKYLGAAPLPATRGDDGTMDWQTALLATAVAIVVYLVMAKVFHVGPGSD